MCLSTVYKNTMAPEAIVMKNVMRIDCKDGCVILTDLMERTVSIPGTLETANLVDGFVVVREADFSTPFDFSRAGCIIEASQKKRRWMWMHRNRNS